MLGRVIVVMANGEVQQLRAHQLHEQSRDGIASKKPPGESHLLMDELRAAIEALANLQRQQGLPPEKMLAMLKGMVAEADGDRLEAYLARSLTADVVRWGIDAYYAA